MYPSQHHNPCAKSDMPTLTILHHLCLPKFFYFSGVTHTSVFYLLGPLPSSFQLFLIVLGTCPHNIATPSFGLDMVAQSHPCQWWQGLKCWFCSLQTEDRWTGCLGQALLSHHYLLNIYTCTCIPLIKLDTTHSFSLSASCWKRAGPGSCFASSRCCLISHPTGEKEQKWLRQRLRLLIGAPLWHSWFKEKGNKWDSCSLLTFTHTPAGTDKIISYLV